MKKAQALILPLRYSWRGWTTVHELGLFPSLFFLSLLLPVNHVALEGQVAKMQTIKQTDQAEVV
jgi:hypothetical protein